MRLPTHIFSKFSTVSVEIIYGNEVSRICIIYRGRFIDFLRVFPFTSLLFKSSVSVFDPSE